MPKLPSFQDVGNVSPGVMRDPGVTAPKEAFQSSSGVIAQELAPGISAVADAVRKEEQRIDLATVNSSRVKLLDLETEQTDWLSQQKGENVFLAKAQINKNIETRLQKIKGEFTNDRQRNAFLEVESEWRASLDRTTSRYVTSEVHRHYDDVDNKLLESSSRAAQKAAGLGEFDRVQQEWMDQEKVIAGYADRKGLDPTQRQAMLDKNKSDFHVGIATQLISEGNDKSAQMYLDANVKEFDADDSLKIQGMLKSRRNEKASEYRVSIADKMQDIEAMAQRGVIPPKGFISDSEIDIAYSDNTERASQIKRRRDEGLRFAYKSVNIHNESNDQIVAALNKKFTPSGDPQNFAEEARHDDLLKSMRSSILTQRRTTPMEYAAQNKIGVVNEIDFSKIESLQAEIPNRIRTSKLMTDRFGSPSQLLTKDEATALSSSLKQASPQKKSEYFATLYKSSDPQSYKSVMSQIAPDDPVTAIAGEYAGKGYQDGGARAKSVSDLIIAGQAILSPNRKDDGKPDRGSLIPMPNENEMRSKFDGYVREAYAGYPQARSDHYQAARAIYAKLSSDAGDDDTSSLKEGRWDEAMKLATGGVEKHNGARVVMPYGYERSKFKDELNARINSMTVELPKGVTASKIRDLPLQSYGDGKYVFRVGDDILGDAKGKPIIVDFNKPFERAKDNFQINTTLGFY